jgi:hypothetical protein
MISSWPGALSAFPLTLRPALRPIVLLGNKSIENCGYFIVTESNPNVQLLRSGRTKPIREYGSSACRRCLPFARQLADEQRAEDLVQETYLRAWK